MLINEKLRREIGREAVRFCRRCPAVEERGEGDRVTFSCHSASCHLWQFLCLLGLRPGSNFDVPTADEALAEAHAREVREFRGCLPQPGPGHNWEADATFHDLLPGGPPDGERSIARRTEMRCRK